MDNPSLSKKKVVLPTNTEMAKKLFQSVYLEGSRKEVVNDEPKIKVSDTVSKMAFYYEKLRTTVDYKEEHLMLKEAVGRILKRLINIEMQRDSQAIAKDLLTELIRAGYLPNNKLPETRIDEIALLIVKYQRLKGVALASTDTGDKSELSNMIIGWAACEIEDELSNKKVTSTVVKSMYQVLAPLVTLPDESPFAADKEIQLYVSIYRTYLRADHEMISYILFKYLVPDWQGASEEVVQLAGNKIDELAASIKYQEFHLLAGQLNRVTSRYTVFFSILTEVIAENPVEVYEELKKDPKAFPRRIKQICNKRYKSVKKTLWRSALRSIIYLFLTKMVLVFILEIPLAKVLAQPVSNFSLFVNVTMPPVLLFLLVLLTATPGDQNTAKIVEGIEQLMFEEKARKEPIKLRSPQPRSATRNFIFNLLYLITFFISFGGVILFLASINFHFVSITIFLFFLALISFFSIRIRQRVKELSVIDARESFFGLIIDFFSVPIIAVGKWLSEKFSKINVLVFILDVLIEMPFKMFVEVAEEWTKYVKERKDDVSQ